MSDLVSIITPTFNRAYILKNPIESVLNQTYENWEMIIIDDGSTDHTKELVDSIGDKRIKYHYQKKKNQSAARNKGLQIAKGEWIVYLDSDNELFPDHLEVGLSEIEKHKNALYALPRGNRLLELYENGSLIERVDDSKDFPKSLTIKEIFNWKLKVDINGFIHHKKIIQSGIKFDENLYKLEDWDFLMQICNKFPDNFLYITKKLYTYHQRYGTDGVVSNTHPKEWAKIFEYLYQKHKNDEHMKGQGWYPNIVEKWNKRAIDYDKGLYKPNMRFFQKSIKRKEIR